MDMGVAMGDAIEGHAQPDPTVFVPPSKEVVDVPLSYSIGEPAPTTGGPGFAYDPDQLNALAAKWDELVDIFRRGQLHADVIKQARGPGLEYASGGNAEMVVASGEALGATLSDRERYCRAQADKCRQAAGKYAQVEDDHTLGSGNSWIRDTISGQPAPGGEGSIG